MKPTLTILLTVLLALPGASHAAEPVPVIDVTDLYHPHQDVGRLNAAIGDTVGITAVATDSDAGDTVSYALTDNAGGRFAIHSTTGVVTVASALDYETATSHDITVLATSSDGSTDSYTPQRRSVSARRSLRHRVRTRPRVFGATLDELQHDVAALRGPQP